MSSGEKNAVLLFDGVCHLCDGAVRFILKREKSAGMQFAPLQSEKGKTLLQKYGYPQDYLEGLVLIENNRAHDRSSACLRVAGKLKFPWKLLFPLLLVPKPIRDGFYWVMASLRYRWFGKKETCSLPNGADINRFL